MKKIILVAFLIISFKNYSQVVLSEEVDEFTKSKNISIGAQLKDKLNLKDNVSSKEDVSLFFNISYIKEKTGAESQALLLTFFFPKSTCLVQENSKLMILLENEEIIETISLGKTDCNKTLTGLFMIKDLTPFLNNNIKKIRIYSSEGIYDITILEDKKKIIKDSFILLDKKINQ